jgi:pyruvate kinase
LSHNARTRSHLTLHTHHPHRTPRLAPVTQHRSYKKLAHDLRPGSSILCADGSIVLEVISTDPAAGTVRARCKNTAMLG